MILSIKSFVIKKLNSFLEKDKDQYENKIDNINIDIDSIRCSDNIKLLDLIYFSQTSKTTNMILRGIFLYPDDRFHKIIIKLGDINFNEIANHTDLYYNLDNNLYVTPIIEVTECESIDPDINISPLGIVLEPAITDIDQGILQNPNSNFENRIRISYLSQMAVAITYCHLSGYAHMDIKPSNFLLFQEKYNISIDPTISITIRLSDFGCSQPVLSSTDYISTTKSPNIIVSSFWRPPEIHCGTLRYLPFAVDVWSFGIMIGELLFNYRIFSGGDNDNDNENVKENIFNDYFDYFDDSEKGEEKNYLNESLYQRQPDCEKDCFLLAHKKILQIEEDKLLNRFKHKNYYNIDTIDLRRIINLFPNSIIDEAIKIYGFETFKEIIRLISQCLRFNPIQRPMMIDILKSPLFQFEISQIQEFEKFHKRRPINETEIKWNWPSHLYTFFTNIILPEEKDNFDLNLDLNLKVWKGILKLSRLIAQQLEMDKKMILFSNVSVQVAQNNCLAIFSIAYDLFKIKHLFGRGLAQIKIDLCVNINFNLWSGFWVNS